MEWYRHGLLISELDQLVVLDSDGADRERPGLAEPVAAPSVVCCAGFPSERKYQHLRRVGQSNR
jgi:hypothetical protein